MRARPHSCAVSLVGLWHGGDIYYVSALAKVIKNCPGIDNQVRFYVALGALNLGVGVCETLNVIRRYSRRYLQRYVLRGLSESEML